MTAKRRRRLLLTRLVRTHGTTARGFFAPQRDRTVEQIPTQSRLATLAKRQARKGRRTAPQPTTLAVSLGEIRAAEREQNRARRQSRREQGWQNRPLTYRALKHDGSTAEQRARRTSHRDSPWIPA